MPEPLASTDSNVEYENYSHTSSQYDETRVEVGLAFINEAFASLGPVNELRLLDAGCGTGNYIDTLRNSVQSIVGVDLNEGMLKHAKQKFQDDPTVTLSQGSLTEIPSDNGQFDAVICNQVLHHLADSDGENRFSRIQKMTKEVFRILRPGGAFVLNLSTPEQTVDGFWWASLIPTAVEKMTRRCPDIDAIHAMLSSAGFYVVRTTALRDEVLQGSCYLDPVGPLKSEWRDGDSTWSLVSGSELESATKAIEEMNTDGTMNAFLEMREKHRERIGQTTSIFALRPEDVV